MIAAVACAFPVLLVAAVRLVLPIRWPTRPPHRAETRPAATTPLSVAQISWGAAILLVASFALALPIALAQKALLAQAAGAEALLFQRRLTDDPAYAFAPGLILGFVVSAPILYRLLVRYTGDRLVDLLDQPDRRGRPAALRRELVQVRRQAWPAAVPATLLNLAAFDMFLAVGRQEFAYSAFWSPVTHRHPTAQVAELVVYAHRRTPAGVIARRSNLEIRLRNGRRFDTNYIIQEKDIPALLAAFRASDGFRGTVRAVDGYP